MHMIHFVYSFIPQWTPGGSYLLDVVHNVAMNMGVRMSAFGCIPRCGMAGSYGHSTFNILRKLHAVFQSRTLTLHSQQQGTRVPVSPHPSNTYFPVFVTAILIGMKRVPRGFNLHFSFLKCIYNVFVRVQLTHNVMLDSGI